MIRLAYRPAFSVTPREPSLVHCAGDGEPLHHSRPIEIGCQRLRIDFFVLCLHAQAAIGGNNRRMTVKARATLWPFRDALRHFLIGEHVCVAAGFAIIDAEGVARVKPRSQGCSSNLLAGIALEPPYLVSESSTVRR